jgi:phage protein D
VGLITPAGIVPAFRVVANNTDITAAVASRFSHMRLTQTTKDESDEVEITLADTDPSNPIIIPPTGAELRVYMGYDGSTIDKGLYVCDEIENGGWPQTMTLRARAAIYAQTPLGKTDFQSQKTRSWASGTTIGAMVSKIATEHAMKAGVSASLSSIQLPHIQQDAESDINMLLRIAKRYDAIAKPMGGVLVFAQRGMLQSVSGVTLPTFTLTPGMVDRWRTTISRRETPGTVVAFWHNKGAAKRNQVTVGSGDPVKRIRFWFTNAQEALAACNAEYQRRTRGQYKLEIEMEGQPSIITEAPLVLSGWRTGIPAEWVITRVEHTLAKDGGALTEIEAELPNAVSTDDDSETDTQE